MPLTALLKNRTVAVSLASFVLLGCVTSVIKAQQPELPRCGDHPTVIHSEFYADSFRWCPESIVHDRQIEPLSFTALAIGADETLYATRPLSGQVVEIRDSDGDELPDTMETFAKGLTHPNGLHYHDGYLYVAGGSHIYRITEEGEVETLVEDLPTGTGFWTGGIVVGDDERLYVAVGAPCDNCEFDEPERGAILSMNLDGSDRQVVATGFRQPADLAFFRSQLWTLDSAPRQENRVALDELNRVEAGGWYGFPYCLGAGAPNIKSETIDCAESVLPTMLFGSGAVPSSLAAYPHDTLPGTKETLVVVLSGDPTQVDFVGFKVIMISFDEANQPLGATILIPYVREGGRQAYKPYLGDGLYWEKFIHLSEQGFGFYPQQPLAVAINARGWIYISMTGGRIIALRPRHKLSDGDEFYPIWTPMNPNFDPSVLPPIEKD